MTAHTGSFLTSMMFPMSVGAAPLNIAKGCCAMPISRQSSMSGLLKSESENPWDAMLWIVTLRNVVVDASLATAAIAEQLRMRQSVMTGLVVGPKTAIAGNSNLVNVQCCTNPRENSKLTPLPSHMSNTQ
jgi:hypothetical protein